MNILALDTSTKNFSLAVFRGDESVAQEDVVLDKVLSDSIVPVIDRMLARVKMSLNRIDGLAVGLWWC